MSKHTPGPWAYRPSNDGHFIAGVGENSGYLAEVRQCRSKQDIRADARLIAAAPELLAALRGMLAIVNESGGVAGYHLNGNTAEWDEFDEVDAARAAIAKAEGGAA